MTPRLARTTAESLPFFAGFRDLGAARLRGTGGASPIERTVSATDAAAAPFNVMRPASTHASWTSSSSLFQTPRSTKMA